MRGTLLIAASVALFGAGCPPIVGECASAADCYAGEGCTSEGLCATCGDGVDCSPPPPPVACGFRETFDDPNLDDWAYNGAAKHVNVRGDGRVRLTSEGVMGSAGALMRRSRLNADAFVLEAVLDLRHQERAPDGFALGWFEDGPEGLGHHGPGIGVMGLRGYAVVLDQFRNRFDAERHVGLIRVTGAPFVSELEPTLGPVFSLIASASLPPLSQATHVVTLVFRDGVANVFLDGARVLTTVVADYQPFDATFGVTASSGLYVGDQDLLELSLSCGDDPSPRGFTHRRELLLDAPPGSTQRVALPPALRPEARPDGRDVAVYQGLAPIAAQWEDIGATESATAALIVRVPSRGEPVYVYTGGGGSDRKTDAVFDYAARFDRGSFGFPSSWGTIPRVCSDRAGGEGGSACALGTSAGATSLITPTIPGLEEGALMELDFHVAGGTTDPSRFLYVMTSTTPTNPTIVLYPIGAEAYDVAWVPTSSATTGGLFGRDVVGFSPPFGSKWRRARARFIVREDVAVLRFNLFNRSRVTPPSELTILLDDVTLRRSSSDERPAELGAVEAR